MHELRACVSLYGALWGSILDVSHLIFDSTPHQVPQIFIAIHRCKTVRALLQLLQLLSLTIWLSQSHLIGTPHRDDDTMTDLTCVTNAFQCGCGWLIFPAKMTAYAGLWKAVGLLNVTQSFINFYVTLINQSSLSLLVSFPRRALILNPSAPPFLT